MNENIENVENIETDNIEKKGDKNKITFANDVIATIAALAASETDGVAVMSGSKGIGEILGGKKSITKGVKVEVGTKEVAVDLYIIAKYGHKIQEVAANIQKNVASTIENMTGLKVVEVNVSIEGIDIEKDEPKKTDFIIEDVVEEPKKVAPEPSPRVQ